MDKIDPKNVRRSVIAGSWYPGTEEQLRKTVQGYLDSVEKEDLEGELIGLISPHAGYIYSGQVAAYAYRQLDLQRMLTVMADPVDPDLLLQRTDQFAVEPHQPQRGLVGSGAGDGEAAQWHTVHGRDDGHGVVGCSIQLPVGVGSHLA